MKAKEIMRKRVISVRPEMTLRELDKLLDQRGITGAPVVSPEGRVLGIVSQTDLLREEREVLNKQSASGKQERVEQAMTPWAVSFEEDTDVRELARQMLAKRIHRVIITKNGQLSGIVTTMDMLRLLLKLLANGRR